MHQSTGFSRTILVSKCDLVGSLWGNLCHWWIKRMKYPSQEWQICGLWVSRAWTRPQNPSQLRKSAITKYLELAQDGNPCHHSWTYPPSHVIINAPILSHFSLSPTLRESDTQFTWLKFCFRIPVGLFFVWFQICNSIFFFQAPLPKLVHDAHCYAYKCLWDANSVTAVHIIQASYHNEL